MPHATPRSPTPAVCQRAFVQSGSSTETGDRIFYNFDTFRGSRQSTGKTDFYNFSDGSSTTRNSVGNTDFYSGSTPSIGGSTNQSGHTTFGNWEDGTTSTHQSVGETTFRNFSNGRNCTSNRVGAVDLGRVENRIQHPVGQAYLLPPLSSGGALIALP